MPFLSDNRGCFCCEPSMSSVSYGNNAARSSVSEAVDSLQSHFRNNPISALTPGFQKIQLHDQCSSQHLSGNCISAGHVLNLENHEDINMFIPASSFCDSKDLSNQSSPVYFRLLQNRELRGKAAVNMYDEIKPLMSNSTESTDYNIKNSQALEGSSINVSDSMDLDSALDELGMLSTVTNSRKQFLIESRGQVAVRKREQRLRSKSESSPNLTNLGRPNGYRIVQLDPNFVTSVSDLVLAPDQVPSNMSDDSPQKSHFSLLEYRNPDVLEEAVVRRRSVPRMSRMRKDRYRRSRCPYKIPNRLCNSMQESDFGCEYFDNCASPYASPNSAPASFGDAQSNRLTHVTQSKSNTASPVKPSQELRLIRSLSAEDLMPIRRRLEQELNDQAKELSRTEQCLDLMTSQMTNLHMT